MPPAPFLQLQRAKQSLMREVNRSERGPVCADAIIQQVLGDRTKAPLESLPPNIMGDEWRSEMSPVFVDWPNCPRVSKSCA